MKLLLDTRIWGRAREELEVAGHDVVWTGDWIEDPGDEEILSHAYRALGVYGEELLAGAIVTVEPGRLRMRPPNVDVSPG